MLYWYTAAWVAAAIPQIAIVYRRCAKQAGVLGKIQNSCETLSSLWNFYARIPGYSPWAVRRWVAKWIKEGWLFDPESSPDAYLVLTDKGERKRAAFKYYWFNHLSWELGGMSLLASIGWWLAHVSSAS